MQVVVRWQIMPDASDRVETLSKDKTLAYVGLLLLLRYPQHVGIL